MMKMKKVWHDEYVEYQVTVTRPNGERIECYNGTVYRKEASAKKYADSLNDNPERVKKCGTATVEAKTRKAGWSWQGTLQL